MVKLSGGYVLIDLSDTIIQFDEGYLFVIKGLKNNIDKGKSIFIKLVYNNPDAGDTFTFSGYFDVIKGGLDDDYTLVNSTLKSLYEAIEEGVGEGDPLNEISITFKPSTDTLRVSTQR